MDNTLARSASSPRDRDWWKFPLTATVLLPLCQMLFWYFVLARAVAVDQCWPRGTCGRDWGSQYDVAHALAVAQLVLVVAAWILPPTMRWAPWRFVVSAVSVLCGLACSVAIETFG